MPRFQTETKARAEHKKARLAKHKRLQKEKPATFVKKENTKKHEEI